MGARLTFAGLVFAGLGATFLALPVQAECIPPFEPLFFCTIPERDAIAEFCENPARDSNGLPGNQYTYFVHGQPELEFQTSANWFGLRNETHGMSGSAMGNGLVHGKLVYAFFIEDAHWLDPREAQIHVYASVDDFNNQAEPIERRYCYPPSIEVTQKGIGP